MQTVTSQAFNQNPAAVKRAATKEPVKITERGKGVTRSVVYC